MSGTVRASASIAIDRDVEAVYDYVAAMTTMAEWVTGVADATLVAGDGQRVGDVYECEYTYRGRTQPMRLEVTALDRPTRVAMRAREGPFPFEGELTLTPEGGGTRVTNTIEPGADGRVTAVLFTVLSPVLRRLMRRRLATELEDLRAALEREDADADASRLSPRDV